MESIKILIVDDTPSMRAFVKASIKASFPSGIEIDEASTGDTARGKLAVTPFDIVICDWLMPGINGTELLEWMKEQDNLKDVPFLMLTAHPDKDIIAKAIEAGVSDFIMKPVSVDTLIKKLNAAIKTALSVRTNKAGGNRPGEDNSSI